MPPFDLLLPNAADFLTLLLVWATGAVLLLTGRLVTGGRGAPEFAFFAGWGAYCLVLTVWGLATAASMRIPAWGFVAAALLALALPQARPSRADWVALSRILLLSLPLWLLFASVKPSLPDTWTNFLPNAVYLFDHGTFPADDRVRNVSIWPALPYNATLVGLLTALPLSEFPPAALILFNLLLFAFGGLAIARLLRPGVTVPGWAFCAAGLLLASAVNPGFTPKYAWSSNGDGATAITFGVGALIAIRLLDRLARGEAWRVEALLYGFTLAALANIRESNIALLGILIVGPMLLAVWDLRIGWRRGVAAFAVAALPAIATYLAWRAYVRWRIPGGELDLLPMAEWHFSSLPLLLLGMLKVVVQNIYLFGAFALAFLLLWRRLRRESLDETARLLGLMAIAFLLYNGFLLFSYVTHFDAPQTAYAHSYFRYNSHLSVLLVMALAAAGRDAWTRRTRPVPAWVPRLVVGAVLVAPAALVGWLRFDLEPPYPLLQRISGEAAGLLPDGAHVALLLPGDNGSLTVLLKAELSLLPPRRPNLSFRDWKQADEAALGEAAEAGYRFAFVSCTPAALGALPPRHAALLAFGPQGWQPLRLWSYPESGRERRWTPAVSGEALCRSN